MSLSESLRKIKIYNRAWCVMLGLVVNLLLSAVFIMPLGVEGATAQTPVSWSSPTNLSHSGSASDPTFAIDSNGTIHVLWRDDQAGYYYVSGNGLQWQDPLRVEVPFADEAPKMLADDIGFIHLFWRGSSDEGLYYTYVRASEFTSLASWAPIVQLATWSLDFAVMRDAIGAIHLVYVRPVETPDFPAGVYYRRIAGVAGSWSEPLLLYPSSYFRSLPYEESHVDIASYAGAGDEGVILTWDNQPRQRIYFARSADGGMTWDNPQEIARPDPAGGVNSPSHLQVGVLGKDIILFWQGLDGGGNCSQFLQLSTDGGITWGAPAQRFDRLPGCAQESKFLRLQDNSILLWTLNQGQVYLMAWDGEQWSAPQTQYELIGFDDPETLKPVSLGCMHVDLMEGNVLALVGCDLGDGGDIWFMSRRLSDIASWFPSQSDWVKSADITRGQVTTGNAVLLAGPGNLFHLLWSQPDETALRRGKNRIYYSAWGGESWTKPTAILNSPEGNADHPSAAVDANGRLLVVWSDDRTGKILFSWATAEKASFVSEWSTPVPLPIPHTTTLFPVILADNTGTINVIYSVPINESRGVYLLQSNDGGETWSSPIMVFDGASAGWEVVGDTQFTISLQGGYYLLISRHSFQREGQAEAAYQGIYYTRSLDSGRNWTALETVDTDPATWGQISEDGDGLLYRIWQVELQGQPQIRYQSSQDAGVTWNPPETLSSFGESLRFTRLVPEHGGSLHLLQIVRDSTSRLILHHWLRDGTKWSLSESFELGYGQKTDVGSMVATLSPGGTLGLVYSTSLRSAETAINGFSFTYRVIESAEFTMTAPTEVKRPAEITTGNLAQAPQPTAAATSTPAPDLSLLSPVESDPRSANTFTGVEVGIALSLLIIGVVFGFGLWKIRANQ